MSGKLSAALKLGDLNDYIAPSQACVVSLNSRIKNPTENGHVQKPPRPLEFKQAEASEPVKVTLHDCLACSGCITSAETVMLEQQSVDEFVNQLESKQKTVVVSLSPQSRASLAAYFDLTPLAAFQRITGFLKSLGVKAVFDTSFSRDLSLIEACEEFVTRYKSVLNPEGQDAASRSFPILASACPGWICYAEKTHGSEIVPYISTVKSPQQVMGAIIKRHTCHTLGLKPEDVYHVTVMPCYDKKLEASRDDFIFSIEREGETGTEAAGPLMTEVDCVLTSGEILDLFKAKNVDFLLLEEVPIDKMLSNVDEHGHLYGVPGGSGSYADTIFRYAARVLFQKEITGHLEYKTLRNADFREISLEVDGKTVLRFACAYGFRNIQNLVRKIKTGKCEYQFVEIMACPSGCLNGGGQIKAKKGQSFKDVIQNLESAYLREVESRDPFDNLVARGLYDQWLDYPGSPRALQILHTSYHQREKSVASQLSNW